MPDDDDRPRDAGSAADGGWADDGLSVDWLNAVAPDDIRELSADIKAYRRELRARRRDMVLGRMTMRLGMRPLSLVAIILVLSAAIATMIVVVMPTTPRALAATTLSTTTKSVSAGGLLPAATLRSLDGTTVQSRSLRPSLIALAPPNCRCAPVLRLAAADATADHMKLVVVAPSKVDPELSSLAGRLGGVGTTVLYDWTAALRVGPIKAEGLTLLAVAPDGTVASITRSVSLKTVNAVKTPLADILRSAESAG